MLIRLVYLGDLSSLSKYISRSSCAVVVAWNLPDEPILLGVHEERLSVVIFVRCADSICDREAEILV